MLKLFLVRLPELSKGFSPALEGLLIAAENETQLEGFLKKENGTHAEPEFWHNTDNCKFIGVANQGVQPGVLLVDWFVP